MIYDSYSASNSISSTHKENQDSLLIDEPNFAVADGVGGYLGGKIASQLCVDSLSRRMKLVSNEDSLCEAILNIHEEILAKARQLNYPMMGTTAAVCKILSGKDELDKVILSANVGDSPIFLIRDKKVIPVYEEDSERGTDPSNMWSLTQYLGVPDTDIVVHTRVMNYLEGDILLVSSDGVSDNIIQGKNNLQPIYDMIAQKKSAREIVRACLETGFKKDDASAIIISL